MNGCDLMEEIARLKEDRDRAIAEANKMRRERNQARREAEKMHYKYCDLYGWGWNEPVFSWQKEEKNA